jgi:hypothetical protein
MVRVVPATAKQVDTFPPQCTTAARRLPAPVVLVERRRSIVANQFGFERVRLAAG